MYFYIGIGGACGSLTRYLLGRLINNKTTQAFPLGTLLINVTGAFLLGIVVNIGFGEKALLMLADGFLGAYTTFSAFMYESFSLFRNRKHINAAVYMAGTVIIGTLFYLAGSLTIKFLVH